MKARWWWRRSATTTTRNYGFNAQSETYGDLVEAGVIDPTKVTRTALQNAASIASLLLTTEALVSEIPQKEDKAPAMPPGRRRDVLSGSWSSVVSRAKGRGAIPALCICGSGACDPAFGRNSKHAVLRQPPIGCKLQKQVSRGCKRRCNDETH